MFQSLISDLKIQNYTSLKLFVEIESDITMQPSSLINFYHYHDLPERQVSWKGTLKKQKVEKESDGCLYAVPQVEGSEVRRCTA